MSLRVKTPLTLDVVEDEVMIETVKSGKYLIIAIPVEDVIIKKRGEENQP